MRLENLDEFYRPFSLPLTPREIDQAADEFRKILKNGTLILGENTENFERAFGKYVGTAHSVAFNSATSGLEILCRLHNVAGRFVAVPTNTNFASVEAIIRAGGRPVFMDMNPATFNSDLDCLKQVFDKVEVFAVLWVHIGGFITPDFIDVVSFCKENGLVLMEDCAHAHGSSLAATMAGNFGDGGVYSFFPTKLMTTLEGGCLVTNNDEHSLLAKSYRNQGKRYSAYGGLHYDHGNSFRITEIGAFMGLIQLRTLSEKVRRRMELARIFDDIFGASGLTYVESSYMDTCSYYKYIITLPQEVDLSDLRDRLKRQRIILGGGVYETPCHLQPVFSEIKCSQVAPLDIAEELCSRQICPPLTSDMSSESVTYIAETIVKSL